MEQYPTSRMLLNMSRSQQQVENLQKTACKKEFSKVSFSLFKNPRQTIRSSSATFSSCCPPLLVECRGVHRMTNSSIGVSLRHKADGLGPRWRWRSSTHHLTLLTTTALQLSMGFVVLPIRRTRVPRRRGLLTQTTRSRGIIGCLEEVSSYYRP